MKVIRMQINLLKLCIYWLGKMLEVLAVDKGKIYRPVFSVRFYFAEEKVYCTAVDT